MTSKRGTHLKNALVVHPQMSSYAGGELLCLYVCKALQESNYAVTLACDVFSRDDVDRIFALGDVLQKCQHVRVPRFSPVLPRLVAPQRIVYAIRTRTSLSKIVADVVFCTQSSSFYFPQKKLFHVVYDMVDLFQYPLGSNISGRMVSKKRVKDFYYLIVNRLGRLIWNRYSPKPEIFFAIGSRVRENLVRLGYRNSVLMFPPCRTDFKPSFPKLKQVVQFARIIPDKRLELFLNIAQMLPQYPFYIVGRIPPRSEGRDYEYAERILQGLPQNVQFVGALTRERPDLLERSKVYLYTGIEPGIGIALIEAISAGCIPFSPREVGAADVIETTKIGYLYDSAENAAAKIKATLEGTQTRDDVIEIASRASAFSPTRFEEGIKRIVTGQVPHGTT